MFDEDGIWIDDPCVVELVPIEFDDMGMEPEPCEYVSVKQLIRENNIAGSEAKTVSELVAELKCDNLQLRAELAQAKKQLEKLRR